MNNPSGTVTQRFEMIPWPGAIRSVIEKEYSNNAQLNHRSSGEISWSGQKAQKYNSPEDNFSEYFTRDALYTMKSKILDTSILICEKCQTILPTLDELELEIREGEINLLTVSAKLLLERDKLDWKLAKDIYDFKRVLINAQIFRLDQGSETIDINEYEDVYFIYSTTSKELSSSELNQPLSIFGSLEIFVSKSLNNETVIEFKETRIASNYCSVCQAFSDKNIRTYLRNSSALIEVLDDELIINGFSGFIASIEVLSNKNFDYLLPFDESFKKELLKGLFFNLKYQSKIILPCDQFIEVASTWIEVNNLKNVQIIFPDNINSKNSLLVQNYTNQIKFDRLGEVGNLFKIIAKLYSVTVEARMLAVGHKEFTAWITSANPKPNEFSKIEYLGIKYESLSNLSIKELKDKFDTEMEVHRILQLLEDAGFGDLTLRFKVLGLLTSEISRLAIISFILIAIKRKTKPKFPEIIPLFSDLGYAAKNSFCSSLRPYQYVLPSNICHE